MRPEWDLIEAPTLTLHFDRDTGAESITSAWHPRWIAITKQLLTDARPDFVSSDADTVTFHYADGDVRYRFVERQNNEILCEMVQDTGEDGITSEIAPEREESTV